MMISSQNEKSPHAGEKEKQMSETGELQPVVERRLVRRCRWCGMVDCGTTGGNDHGSGFVDRSDKCKLYEAMACYVKAREEITHLKATLENLRNIVTTGNESKESFIRRVNAVLHPSNRELSQPPSVDNT